MKLSSVINRVRASLAASSGIQAATNSRRIVAALVKGFFIQVITLGNSFNLSEAIAKLFGKSLSDSANATEELAKDFSKSLTDTIDATDDVDGVADLDDEQNIDFYKAVTDAFAAAEAHTIDVGKTLQDSAGFTDVQRFDIGKALATTQSTTDSLARDFHKKLGLDTDQDYVTDGYFWDDYVVGSSTEILDVNEQISLQPNKPLTDSATFGDSVVRQADYSRSLADTVYATDDVIGQAGVDDQQNMQFWKFTTEVPVVSENVKLALGFTKADSAVATESTVIDFGRYLSDSPVATDSTSFGYGKDFTESPAFTDSNVIAFDKALTEGTISSDQAVLSVNQTRSDSASSSDSGVLLNQDYVASSDYFADDYVGAKRAI